MSPALTTSQTPSVPVRAGVSVSSDQVSNANVGAHGTGLGSVCVNSTTLLRGQKAVEINHNGSTYRLQATRLGKLILTK